ncbi:TetR/AcrR family transcriptional regulator [Streptomyces sp. NPDC058293]|uniref:TetR/AcrR family transcriptional regulator n=1 Tax=Streptomyces sp. NBC_00119 TaxID=2975659 RepID=A0AAU1U113_9ACTN|nr:MULTISPECIES: TetR/AcrR family transcriptional regulator [unclassified Streptomyces]MCX4648654.1 TetR/AcrR family transcriptional regulator [Streptomyces sp. NBC_01446]MCX5323229.1 TetR/AcrR family transcriptional regulator [Streptomyces sp. NBC_00120]
MAAQAPAADGGQKQPITPRSARGVRTRNALITAAREVFERDGYLDARITDISKAAHVASGSFYTYFNSKEEIFQALVEQVQEEMLHPHLRERTGITDTRQLIDASNREYLRAYKKNARLMALFEQVAQIDEKFMALRIERGNAFARRNAKLIQALQESGEADTSLDPLVTAHALSVMVSRMAYMVFVMGQRIPFERLVTTLNKIWENGLQLTASDPER